MSEVGEVSVEQDLKASIKIHILCHSTIIIYYIRFRGGVSIYLNSKTPSV